MTPTSTLTTRDAVREAWLDLRSRPGRSALTAVGTLIGIAVLVSTLGLAASLDAQVAARFDALTMTEVTVSARDAGPDAPPALPVDAPSRALRIGGTVAAGNLSEVKNIDGITGTPGYDPTNPVITDVPVFAATAALLDALRAEVTGRFLSGWHDDTGQAVAVLGVTPPTGCASRT